MAISNLLVYFLLAIIGSSDLFFRPMVVEAKTILMADGVTDTYTLISDALGAARTQPEVPDCGHNLKHILQGKDGQLDREVFYFLIHRDLDDDFCTNQDRQRNEIKTNKDELEGFHGETVSHSWNFKLDAAFQPSKSFTHIHQLKDVGGASGTPIMTLTPRKGSTNTLQVIHVGNDGVTNHLGDTPLDPILGVWVHVQEEATYKSDGHYSLRLSRLEDGQEIYKIEKSNIDLWRDGGDYVRSKWGIYRSLNDIESLRDEAVRYDSFCIAKGSEKCT